MSALGSGVDQNQYLLDGTNITATGNGVARADPGVDFIQELQIQSVGASVEYGNVQGAVVNVITRSGGNRFRTERPTSGNPRPDEPAGSLRVYDTSGTGERLRTHPIQRRDDQLGGPVARDRVWFFSAYQHQRDSDSQPGTNPGLPRKYEQDKIFAKLTWRTRDPMAADPECSRRVLVNPETPSATKPRDATQRLDASVPAINFGHLTHTATANTVWDIRVGRFRFTQDTSPTSGDPKIPNRVDFPQNVWSGGPQQIGQVRQLRTTVKATLSHYRAQWFGADHEWRVGGQIDRGEHSAVSVLPTGESFVFENGSLTRRAEQAPTNSGGRFVTAAGFVSDALRVGTVTIIRAPVRPQPGDQPGRAELDVARAETGRTIEGRGTLDTWNTCRRAGGRRQARRRRTNGAASQRRAIQPGDADG